LTPHHHRLLSMLVSLLVLFAAAGCRASAGSHEIVIHADGKDISLSTTVLTVREALAEANVSIDDDDRVEPDLWVEVEAGMTIQVFRVQEETIVEREIMPYKEQTIKSESIAAGDQKLLQAGKNGEVEVTYRLQFQDGVEVSRSVLRQIVVEEPVNQITVVGVGGLVESVLFEGTIAYLNAGTAWLMRGGSGGRRPVTSESDLDERVFALSPDGKFLLYSVVTETVEFDGPFNELYLLNVALVGEEPMRLPIQNVLWADWAPDGKQIAYTLGVKSGPPGWKANNDLWVVSLLDEDGEVVDRDPRRILGAQSAGTYSWWGTRYAWSPDGGKIAYARPDQVGWVDMTSRRSFPLAPFAPLNTHGDWVWVPTPTWSPDSWFIACTIHAEEPGQPPEESQRFEVWAFDIGRQVRARLTPNAVGMWSEPRWSPPQEGGSQIAFAVADTPSSSYDSRYTLHTMDRDGSNKRERFPREGEVGMAQPISHAWSPDGRQLVTLYLGDLYLVDILSGRTQRVTGDGQSTQLDWAE
jgi:Tol biopolymer transport system component